MRFIVCLVIFTALLCGCGAESPEESVPETTVLTVPTTVATEPATTEPKDPLELMVEGMSTEEKVGQLFLARCPEEEAIEDIANYHLGGYILFGRDFADETPVHMIKTLAEYQASAQVPLLIAVDEEGGTVCRVSSYTAFRNTKFQSPQAIYNTKGMAAVLDTESEKAELLSKLGINVNMAPVCDVTTTPGAFMYARSLGQNAQITAEFVEGAVQRHAEYNVGCVLKHFPGYGNSADTHTGIAVDNRELEEFERSDLIPFAAGIAAGADAVLVSHTIVHAFDDALPASLSPAVHEYLRENMSFQGVIVTDDLAMGAITEAYGAEEAAVLAVLAGNDLLCSTEYRTQYQAVLEAVESGRISMEQLNTSVLRILTWKQELKLL